MTGTAETAHDEVVRAPALEMRGITKRYPGVVANDHIDLEVRPGEIHALLGENGAGKSDADEHPLRAGDARTRARSCSTARPVTIAGPSDAIDRGISMVHQHFMLVPVLTVAENILLGEETMANPIFLDRDEARRRIVELGQRFGFEIDPDAKVGRLSVGWQQRVEILKALYRERADPRPRRADRRPDAAGDRGDLRRPAAARRRGPQHHLHQPQAVRGARDRRPDHGHPARQGRRASASRPRPTRRTWPQLMVGREVQLVVDRGESHPADADARRSKDLHGRGRSRPRGRPEASTSRSGPARSSASPASPATARTSWSRRSTGLRKPAGRHGHARRPGRHRPDARATIHEPGVALRPGRPPPVRARAHVPARGQPRPHRLLPTALRARHRPERRARSRERARGAIARVRHPDAVGERHAPARCPAATSRRSSSPASSTASSGCWSSTSRRAASTSAASSSSTGRRSRSATRARRSCSSRPSWTRCSSCPTGSR